ncbi:MAG TPA: YqkE family protein [Bacillota bacterium]|nr:YqkE family protein [Bacillota bacterium]
MKKRKNQQPQKLQKPTVQPEDKGINLSDFLNPEIANQLKSLKKEKEAELQKLKEEEMAKKLFEQKQREKNKSFEELLNETHLDWKKFK